MKPETLNRLGLYIKENKKGRIDFTYFYVDPQDAQKISYKCGELMSNILLSNHEYGPLPENIISAKFDYLQSVGFIKHSDSYIEAQIKKVAVTPKANSANKLIDWLSK